MVACVTAGLSAPIGRAAAGPEGAGVVGVAGLGLVASMVVTVVFVVAEAPSCGWLWVAQPAPSRLTVRRAPEAAGVAVRGPGRVS